MVAERRNVGLSDLGFLEASDSMLAAHDSVQPFGQAADVARDYGGVLLVCDIVKGLLLGAVVAVCILRPWLAGLANTAGV